MKRYIQAHRRGDIDAERVAAINAELLAGDMPVATHGALYLDGEGTATAAVAKRGAELFNDGAYGKVVMAGTRRPWLDWKSAFIFPKVLKDGLPLPKLFAREADYMMAAFRRYADPEKFERYKKEGRFVVIPTGNNAGAKARACAPVFNEEKLVQCVTLAYSMPRLVGTILKESDLDVAVTGERVFPFGITRENWPDWWLSYTVLMMEADKTGPRLDGRPPLYADFFKTVDLEEEGERAVRMDDQLALGEP